MKSKLSNRISPTRRDLIKTVAAVGTIAGVDSLFGASQGNAGKTPHVVIVGAGLAGLCAAYLLQKNKCTYTILEAERHHVGGRVRTMPIGNGLYWEAGAMRIPATHEITRKYVKQFEELALRPFVMDNPKTFLFARGQRQIREKESEFIKFFNLKPAEANESYGSLWDTSVYRVAKGLSSDDRKELEFANSFTSARLIDLDRLSLRQLIQSARISGEPLSDEAIEYILFGTNNLGIQHGAATEFLREELTDVWTKGFSEIVGGTGGLPQAFLRRLDSKPKMGCEVIRLEQDQSGNLVRAIYKTGGGLGQEEGDFLLCTIPFSLLARIEAEPAFSTEKRRAIIELGYDSGTKVAVLAKNRFWETNHGIFGGTSSTDMITGSIVYPSDNAPDEKTGRKSEPSVSNEPGVLIVSYAWGQDARRLGAMTASEREEFATSQAGRLHPELNEPGMIIDRASWAWDTYRWCGGAFALYQPDQFTRMHRYGVQPEGRIYFAGEHCSLSHSWMQGALESAEQAIEALLSRAGGGAAAPN
jgi:monoamine oxidase